MFKKILNMDDLWIGEKKGLILDGVPILMVHTESGIFAFKDQCPHAGARLSEGSFCGHVITCARHQWQFDALTGKGINPLNSSLCQYMIKIDENNDIWIDIDIGDKHG